MGHPAEVVALTSPSYEPDREWPSAPDAPTVRRLLNHTARLHELVQP